MIYRSSILVAATTAAVLSAMSAAQAFDEGKYPNWKGQWLGIAAGQNSPWDPAKPSGAGQQPPLTSEYQAIFEANLKSVASGGAPPDPTVRCSPAGMPRIMMAVRPMEIVVTPRETDILLEAFSTTRRIYTDGRKFPSDFEPRFTGYSIGEWQNTDGDGRFDTFLIETHGIKGPHTYDASGIPFHKDGEVTVKEKLYSDKSDPNILHNEITTMDHALTRPWTVARSYRRDPSQREPQWAEFSCSGDPTHVLIGNDYYALSPDGLLMPVRQGQTAPDLRYFK
jgi:hypothetical protein